MHGIFKSISSVEFLSNFLKISSVDMMCTSRVSLVACPDPHTLLHGSASPYLSLAGKREGLGTRQATCKRCALRACMLFAAL